MNSLLFFIFQLRAGWHDEALCSLSRSLSGRVVFMMHYSLPHLIFGTRLTVEGIKTWFLGRERGTPILTHFQITTTIDDASLLQPAIILPSSPDFAILFAIVVATIATAATAA